MKIPGPVIVLLILIGAPGYAANALPNGLHRISGVVVDTDGRPLPGAIIEVSTAGIFQWQAPLQTKANGEFVLSMSRGKHVVTAMAPGYVATSSLVELRPDQAPAPLRLVMAKGGITLAGKVLDPRNHPVSSGEVWVQNIGTFRPAEIFHTAVRNGSYSLSLPAGGYRIFWRYPGLRIFRDSVVLDAPTTKDLQTPAQAQPAGPKVLEWVRTHAVPLRTAELDGDFSDLSPFGDMIGNARLVGLGEATHGTHEFQSLKVRLFQYLVAKKGFTVFTLEEDFNGVTAINDFVQTGRGDPKAALAGLDVQWWDTQEMLDLVIWARAWNADPTHLQKVSFWGFDARGLRGPYKAFQPWLQQNMPAMADRMKVAGIDQAFVNQVSDDASKVPLEGIQKAWDLVVAALADLEVYATSHPTMDLGAVRMNMILGRGYLEMWLKRGDFDIRDRYMAENALAILAMHGLKAKGVAWAHNGHVAAIPDRSGVSTTVTMGGHLRKTLGQDYFVLGFSFDHGGFRAADAPFWNIRKILKFDVSAPYVNSVDASLTKVGQPLFLLNLRGLVARTSEQIWFDKERPMWGIGGGFNPSEPEYALNQSEIAVSKAFDALVHVQSTTPVRLNSSRWSVADLPFAPVAESPNNLGFQDCGKDGIPVGWQLTSYEDSQPWPQSLARWSERVVTTNPGTKDAALTLTPFPDGPERVLVLAQTVDPAPYRGKKVVISALARTGDQTKIGDVHLWGRANGLKGPYNFQVDQVKTGKHDGWAQLQVELLVGSDAAELAYGFSNHGSAPIQIKGLAIQVVK